MTHLPGAFLGTGAIAVNKTNRVSPSCRHFGQIIKTTTTTTKQGNTPIKSEEHYKDNKKEV